MNTSIEKIQKMTAEISLKILNGLEKNMIHVVVLKYELI